jgi:hypothetical protein
MTQIVAPQCFPDPCQALRAFRVLHALQQTGRRLCGKRPVQNRYSTIVSFGGISRKHQLRAAIRKNSAKVRVRKSAWINMNKRELNKRMAFQNFAARLWRQSDQNLRRQVIFLNVHRKVRCDKFNRLDNQIDSVAQHSPLHNSAAHIADIPMFRINL